PHLFVKDEVSTEKEKTAETVLMDEELQLPEFSAPEVSQIQDSDAPKRTETFQANFCIYEGVLERCEVYGNSIKIPEGVTALADRVFYGMSGLEEIVFPSTLTYIGVQALEGTAWLEREREKGSYVVVNGILVSAFYNSMVVEAKLPDNIYRIAPYAFYKSEAQLVILPESVREVDARAFVESGVTEIDFSPRTDVIFHTPLAVRCNSLRELYFQGKTDRLEEGFVEDCPALKRVCLKWSQTVVSKGAFPENVRIWVL
ncbi:MAG: leucine-rich repeat protein, partial [Lachnospiraceae bacterium]|nr:leucine-rich repeat protein [Lachnospiraceae bacterium]